MKNRTLAIFIILAIVVIGIASILIFNGGEEEEPNEISKIEGKYYDEKGNLLGMCKKWEEYESGNSGPGVTHEEFYDEEENLVGNCWAYHGPGSSGGAGIGCDSDKLLEESFEGECAEEPKPHWCKPWPKYSCSVN